MRRPRPLLQRIALTYLLVGVLFVGTLSPIASRPAQAMGMTVIDPITGLNTTVTNIWDYLEVVLVNGGAVAIINGLNFMMQTLAYDTAVYLASGGKGEGTLFENKSFGTFARDLALSGAGEALGTLSEMGFAGFNLCDPTAAPPSLRLSIFLGLAGTVAPPPRPRCEWNEIAKNWDEYITSVETGEALRGTLLTFQPGQSELGVAFGSNIKLLEYAGKKANEGIEENRIGQGFKSLVNPISGSVMTPSQAIKAEAEGLVGKGTEVSKMTNAQVGSALAAGAVAIIPAAIATLTNTFASQLMHRIFTEGLLDVKTVTCPGFDLFSKNAGLSTNFGVQFGAFGSIGNTECALNNPEFAGRGGRAAAQASFADFLTPRIVETSQYDAITDFTVCPDTFRTPSNCVMDSQFAAAVRQSKADQPLTVSDALTRGYLHGDWPLVSANGADAAKNADPFCFTTGYCYSNLVKMRKARIIPIGWELAAAKATNGSPTLKEVIDGFNDCPTENSPLPQDHPWCRLIDPNWILKYPVTQCKAKVYGPTLISTESDLRAQICVDTPSCIAENEEGTCESGYGYCTREKNIWRLGGDECPAEYATCATFTARAGGTASGNLSLLSNTADRSVCTSDNVGCRGYALDQDPAEGTGDWLTSGRVFLDRDAGVCEARDAGCTELYSRQTSRVNLVRNSSFELDDDRDGLPDFWVGTVGERADSFVDSGIYSVSPSDADDLIQTIWLEPGRTYTISAAAARRDAATPVTVTVGLTLRDQDGQPIVLTGIDTTCDLFGASLLRLPISPEGAEFERLGCRFTTPDNPLDDPGAALNYARVSVRSDSDAAAWLDSIQIEEGPVFSTYHEQAYVDAAASYLRLPPDFLGCAGDPATDDPTCESYSAVCRADEVGCERYTPSDGSPPVPGIVADGNRCPAECAGYSTWRQEPSNYDVGSFPNYFIPTTARVCTASVAGCSEFTNLDTLAAGGEAREYYSYLRACANPRDDAGAVYYTWEGSDTSGFQLKEWRFVTGDPLVGRPEEVGARPPRLVSEVYDDTCTSDIYAAGTNPDCREFFDTSGNRSYRPYSRTVVVTEECHPYRITQPAVDSSIANQGACGTAGGDWIGGVTNQCVFCSRFGGAWDAATNECTYNGFPTESNSCGAAENGCRLYTGNAGRNVRQVFFNDFESGKGGWTDPGTAVSAESTVVGEHSLRVDVGTLLLQKDVSADSDTPIFEGGTYYLSFWAKGRGNLTARFSGAPSTDEYFANQSAALGGNWQVYNFGPVLLDRLPMVDEQLIIENFADISYIDNIILRQADEAIAVVKNSWITPASCDQTREGAALPQAMLGCTEYNDRQGAVQTLTGFDSICRDAAVGCAAFADTRASDSPGRETWNAMCVVDSPVESPIESPTACEVGGKTVCTVGVGTRSCRYHALGEVEPVICRGINPGNLDLPCFIDGTFICSIAPPLRPQISNDDCTGFPADTLVVPEDTTRFIVEDQRFQCEAAKVGCTDAGLPKQAVCTLPDGADIDDDPDACQTSSCDCLVDSSLACRVSSGETVCRYPLPYREPFSSNTSISYEPVIVQNAPRTYERSICTLDAVGCEEWSTSGSEGGTAYFKAPDERICEYRENVSVDGVEFDGWFREGTDDACDPNFVVSGVFNGIRRNGDPEYQGWAGSCPGNFAGCTEFRDPTDKNAALYPEGKPYYALKNAKLDITSCKNDVSQKTGCVLFNDTSNAFLTANATVTNLASSEQNEGLVPAVSCPGGNCAQCLYETVLIGDAGEYREYRFSDQICGASSECQDGLGPRCVNPNNRSIPGERFGFIPFNHPDNRYIDEFGREQSSIGALYSSASTFGNDANAVIKVKQDRVCGEWLACRSRTPVFDPQTSAFKEVCNLIGVCDAVSGTGESIQCTHWITDREQQVLTEEIYRNRDVSYAGLEYAGYSIPNQYPADSLEQVGVGQYCNQTFNADGSRKACEDPGDCAEGDRCEAQFRLVLVIGICTADNGEGCSSSGQEGTCYSGKCVVSIRGNTDSDSLGQPVPLQISGVNRNDTIASCRAYPEQNSPFPASVSGPGGTKPVLVSDWRGDPPTPESVVNGFQKAKLCEKDQDCECSYVKANYASGDRFFNPSSNPFEGLCQGGTKDGTICATNNDCKGEEETDIGTCQRLDRKDSVFGLPGYCLERDLATPLNGQQFDVGDLPSRACNTWLPVDRLAGSADIYNNFASAGFNPGGNVYACAVPEVYKVAGLYGDPNHKQTSTRNIEGKEYTVTNGCWEYDGDQTDLTLVHGDSEEDLEIYGAGLSEEEAAACLLGNPIACVGGDDSPDDKHPSKYYCTKDDGFMILARRTQDCGVGDEDVKFVCVPKNSVHMALPDRPACKPSDAGGALSDAFKESGTRLRGSYLTTLQEENPSIWIVAGGDGRLSADTDLLSGPFSDRGNVFDVFVDCQTLDAEVPNDGSSSGENLRNTGPIYFGCQDVLQVAKAGENPKAVTGNIGNGRVAPPASGIITTDPLIPTIEYNWHAPPPPYGIANTNDIFRVTDSIDAPIQLPYCPGSIATLPKAAADPGADTPSCVQPTTTTRVKCAGTGGSCDPANYQDCIEKVIDDNLCGENTIPIIGWCNIEGFRNGGGLCATGAFSDDECPYRCIPLNSFHNDEDFGDIRQSCDEEFEQIASEREGKKYIRINPNEVIVDNDTRLSNSRFNDCVVETPADTEAFYGFPDHFSARPYIDIRVSKDRDDLENEQCDSIGNCRDYGADEPVSPRGLLTRMQERLGQLFTKVYDAFRYVPRSGNTAGDYVEQDPSDLVYSDRAAELGTGGPTLAAVGGCFDGSRCIEGARDNLTVNGQSAGDVVGGGQLGVELKFYAYADNNQMPIRQIVVDWGDGTVDGPFPGSYKNHRGFRRAAAGHESLCDNSNFGTSQDACDDSSPFVYAYTYTCNSDASGNGVCPADASACSLADGNRDGVLDCVYTPRVQVKDNWGFCNGVCNLDAADESCYDNSDRAAGGIGVNECFSDFVTAANNGITPWTAYSGRIVVSP